MLFRLTHTSMILRLTRLQKLEKHSRDDQEGENVKHGDVWTRSRWLLSSLAHVALSCQTQDRDEIKTSAKVMCGQNS